MRPGYVEEAERRAATAYEFFKAGIDTARKLEHEVKVREDLAGSHEDFKERARDAESSLSALKASLKELVSELETRAIERGTLADTEQIPAGAAIYAAEWRVFHEAASRLSNLIGDDVNG